MFCFCCSLALEASLYERTYLFVHVGEPGMGAQESFHRGLSWMAFVGDVQDFDPKIFRSRLIRCIWDDNCITLIDQLAHHCKLLPYFQSQLELG